MQFGCARNGNYPRLSCQQPCQRDLRRRRVLLLCKSVEQNHHCAIRVNVFWTESWDSAAKVSVIELRFWGDLSGQKALTERAVGNEADAEFVESRHNLLFWSPEPK